MRATQRAPRHSAKGRGTPPRPWNFQEASLCDILFVHRFSSRPKAPHLPERGGGSSPTASQPASQQLFSPKTPPPKPLPHNRPPPPTSSSSIDLHDIKNLMTVCCHSPRRLMHSYQQHRVTQQISCRTQNKSISANGVEGGGVSRLYIFFPAPEPPLRNPHP